MSKRNRQQSSPESEERSVGSVNGFGDFGPERDYTGVWLR